MCDEPWSDYVMYPCQSTICEKGEALVCAVYGFQLLGLSCDVGMVHKFMVANGGYEEDCNVKWSVMDGLNFPPYNEVENPQYNQLCLWARTFNVIVISYLPIGSSERRSALLVDCDDIGGLFVRDGNMTFSTLPYSSSYEYHLFLSRN